MSGPWYEEQGPTTDEVRKKLITLWNIYSFYATYAAVDGFDPKTNPLIREKLNVLDRWIIAKTHMLLKVGKESMDNYRVDRFMKEFEIYLDELSNWYIRRNRRRFWKSEDDQDKNSAYATLYHVLTNIIKAISPVLPFISETIYQNLVINSEDNPEESVHLCDYPLSEESWIELDLIRNVDALKKCVELGRSARSQSNIKIRQPLSKVSYAIEDDNISRFFMKHKDIILDELNVKTVERITESGQLISYKIKPNLRTLGKRYGKGLSIIKKLLDDGNTSEMVSQLQKNKNIILDGGLYTLVRDDIFIETVASEGFAAESGSGITVGLTLELNDDLIMEGMVREIVRFVQSMRKNAGLAVEDRIEISWDFDGQIAKALGKFQEYFQTETLVSEILDKIENSDYTEKFEINNQIYKIELKKYR